MLTIVMYHYVRDLPNTPWPRIKALLTRNFDGQLDYIQRHYTVVGADRVLAAAAGESELPANACLLTFDDGLTDHFETVFPRLVDRGLTGCFFPPAEAVEGSHLMMVNKVHFILAAADHMPRLMRALFEAVGRFREKYALPADDALKAACTPGAARYDDAETVLFKRMLQQALPRPAAEEIAASLFRRFVGADEAGFARQLYISPAQARRMAAEGMGFGGHGFIHDWLEHRSPEAQAEDLMQTRAFLGRLLGRIPERWIMNYPYGSHNAATIQAAARTPGCLLGVTTRPGVICDWDRPFELCRLDANDLPCSGGAEACEWTRLAAERDCHSRAA